METGRAHDFTVKVQLQDGRLEPNTRYRYRFYYGDAHSKTGRFETLPALDASVNSARFAYISCEDYTNGCYHYLRFLA